MPDITFVDTDILIDAGRNIEEAVESLEKIGQEYQPALSVVTQMELISKNQRDYRFIEGLDLLEYPFGNKQ